VSQHCKECGDYLSADDSDTCLDCLLNHQPPLTCGMGEAVALIGGVIAAAALLTWGLVWFFTV
jgi:hypothetical protein